MRAFSRTLLFSLAPLALMAQTPLIPLVPGNSWTLKSPYSPTPIIMSVQWAEIVGNQRVASLLFDNPLIRYSIIVSSDSAGIWTDGIGLNGIEQRYFNPGIMYPAGGTAGQTWTGEPGSVRLVSTTETVTTKLGTFSNCRRYLLTAPDGSTQSWVIAPGQGFVAFGDPAWAFVLEARTLNPDTVATPTTVTSNCPSLGLASIPNSSSMTLAQREGALLAAYNAGSRVLNVNARWNELEPTGGTYSLTRVRDELQLAQKYNLSTILTIGPIYATVGALPADLAGRAWDDPLVVSRFNSLMAQILPSAPSQVKWLNVGYEVDIYFQNRPSEIPAYRRFLDLVKPQMKAYKNIPVGTLYSFETFRASNNAFVAFDSFADQISFDYYAITKNFLHLDPAVAEKDIWLMARQAKGRPLILAELGYASSVSAGSSETKQRQFFDNIFASIQKRGNIFRAVSIWSLNDMPPEAVMAAMDIFKVYTPEFAGFLGGLGLRTSVGAPKQVWSSYTTKQSQFSTPNACTTPQ